MKIYPKRFLSNSLFIYLNNFILTLKFIKTKKYELNINNLNKNIV